MKFEHFLSHIPKIEQEILLGEVAHRLMMPPERAEIMKSLDLKKINPRKAAVMMLFYPRNEHTNMILILRNSYNGVHSSQIAFPGGKIEAFDESFMQAALRETHEEVGISPDQITVVRPFTQVYIPPSNFMVFPFLGYSKQELVFTPDPNEVAGLIEFPVAHFLDDTIVVSQKMATSYSQSIDVPSFKIYDHYVWGATAMMLSELKETLKKVI